MHSSRTIFFIIILGFLISLDVYIYFGLKGIFPKGTLGRKIALATHLASILVFLGMIAAVFISYPKGMAKTTTITSALMGVAMSFAVAKLIFVLFLFGEDIYRVGRWLVERVIALFSSGESHVVMESRRGFIGKMGLVVAAIPFAGMMYGYLRGKYDYRVEKVTLNYPDLPEAFDGMRIAQISDVHAGSFEGEEAIAKGLKMLQDQQPDVIFFTGDLVNNLALEVEPYLHLFENLSAPLGKFSILGNHDYGHYISWDRKADEIINHKQICEHHGTMGFRLLKNEGLYLEKGGQKIYLAGVENWGRKPFPQYGDLDAALANGVAEDFTILLSHDPTHWDEKVLSHPKQIHLTLSGHTHGGQMGIEIPGFRWSPSQWVYRRWAGLYEEAGQYLNVNRGFGFLGYPGRAGIPPEITLIELRRA